jgi:hypothetical protein
MVESNDGNETMLVVDQQNSNEVIKDKRRAQIS